MKELSIFIDESGDFGGYDPKSPYYIVSLVFHDQSNSITDCINRLNAATTSFDMPTHNIHSGPLVRREGAYLHTRMEERRALFGKLFHFVRISPITYTAIIAERRSAPDALTLTKVLSKQLYGFLSEHLSYFVQYTRVVVYYDNGQVELTKLLAALFGAVLSNVEFRNVRPADYKLFQAADMVCTLELARLKAQRKALSRSEMSFFVSERELNRRYLRHLDKKRFM